jgi:hypothetical protein
MENKLKKVCSDALNGNIAKDWMCNLFFKIKSFVETLKFTILVKCKWHFVLFFCFVKFAKYILMFMFVAASFFLFYWRSNEGP